MCGNREREKKDMNVKANKGEVRSCDDVHVSEADLAATETTHTAAVVRCVLKQRNTEQPNTGLNMTAKQDSGSVRGFQTEAGEEKGLCWNDYRKKAAETSPSVSMEPSLTFIYTLTYRSERENESIVSNVEIVLSSFTEFNTVHEEMFKTAAEKKSASQSWIQFQ